MAHTIRIDQYSVASMVIEMRSATRTISRGTAFSFYHDSQLFLITNWHNVTGKDPRNGKHLSSTAAEPVSLHVHVHVANRLGTWYAQTVSLYDEQGRPTWYEHPAHGRNVDVIAIPINLTNSVEVYPINRLKAYNDMVVEVGNDLYILGFPFGLLPTAGFPVWKRASIATEPDLDIENLPKFMVDTASRPGMSGSPVIRRCDDQYRSENGNIHMVGGANKFVGIYSGRIGAEDELKAQLGIVWRAEVIEAIISGGVIGSR